LSPFDEEMVLESVKKTGRLVVVDESHPRCSMAADIAALVADKGFDYLNGPIKTVTAPHTPVPFSPTLEDHYLPNPQKIMEAALAGIDGGLRILPRFLEMSIYDEPADSTRAAKLMHEQGIACAIVIGGDGTNRVVTKGCGPMPLVPLSTGTNNAFPRFLESTLA